MNAELRRVADAPVWAALVSFTVGGLSLVLYFLATRATWPARERFADAPPWIWVGGALGAFIVFSTILAAPKLGASTLVVATVAGQLLASVVIDHFGWIGFTQHPISLGRVAGVLLLLAGVFLIQRF